MKKLPNFKNEDEERDFWAKHDLGEVFDLKKGKVVTFPNLRLTSTTISLRLPLSLLNKIKVEANKRDMPYQSLMKMKLVDAFQSPSARVLPS